MLTIGEQSRVQYVDSLDSSLGFDMSSINLPKSENLVTFFTTSKLFSAVPVRIWI